MRTACGGEGGGREGGGEGGRGGILIFVVGITVLGKLSEGREGSREISESAGPAMGLRPSRMALDISAAFHFA
jgi:hypothetical protein